MDSLVKISLVSIFLLTYFLNVEAQCGTSSTYSATASTTTIKYITSANYPSYYENYIRCTSTISTTGTGGQILFHVVSQSIERRYDYLTLYTGSITSSNLLHNSDHNSEGAVGVTNVNDRLIARFTTDGSITYGGYKLGYLQVGTLGNCGESLTASGTEQQLTYVNRRHGATCQWTISPPDASNAVHISLIFLDGSVRIREGGVDTTLYTVADTFTGTLGTDIQIIGSSNNNFVLMYSSNNNGSPGAVTVSTQSTSTSDTSSICYERYKTAVSAKRYLNSPNYPGIYPNNQYCLVTISASNPDDSVSLDIVDLVLQNSDHLKIYNGLGTSYDEIPLTTTDAMVSWGDAITVLFQTDSFSQNRGFNLTYESVTRTVPSCSVTVSEMLEANESHQTLSSPNYPNNYLNNIDVYWLIVKPNVSSRIILDFTNFHLELSSTCVYDYVALYDGSCTYDPLMTKICGDDTVTYEEVTGLYILIHFHSDSSVTDLGFSLTYYIGTFQDPDADGSTDDSGSGAPDYIYPIIGIVVFSIVAIIVVAYIYIENRKRRVGDGVGVPKTKRRTVSNLLQEIKVHVSAQDKKTTKQPVSVKQRDPLPPPPQNLPPLLLDPAFPPVDYRDTGLRMPKQNIVPAIPQGGRVQPSAPILPNTSGSMIPPPFIYLTPSEARKAGIHE